MKFKLILLVIFVIKISISFSQTIPLVQTKSFSPESEDEGSLENYCSLGCAVSWDVTASSTLTSIKGYNYSVKNLDDGLLATAWVGDNSQNNIGQKITFIFKKNFFDQAQIKDSINFNGFRIVNGYAKNKSLWKYNSRVKILRVFHNDEVAFDIQLQDNMLIQEANLKNAIYLKANDSITAMILSIYPGEKHKEIAISELTPLGAH